MDDKIGLYIHIPFCERKCNYCDFTSFAGKESVAAEYCERLKDEIKSYPRCAADTVYFGGGTPSSIDESLICRVLETATEHFSVDSDAEITIEINPSSAIDKKLEAYKRVGFNRISMGAQSFDDGELAVLGRLHDSSDIYTAYELTRKYGFDNVSLDLMFGLPDQTAERLGESIDKLVALSPDHISCYGLKIEEGTQFFSLAEQNKLNLPDDDELADLYDFVCERMSEAGYTQYEISNFAKNGKYSRHNSRYWRCGEYIGFGLGASSYLNGVRSKNTGGILSYGNETEEILSLNDKMSEFVILGLRMANGISISEFEKRFGRSIYEVFDFQLRKHAAFIKKNGGRLFLEREAFYVSNAIFADFLL